VNVVRIGCSGWQYDSWRGDLYPEREPKRRWLELYAEHFDTVEVNSTFYRLARRSAVEGWVAQTPPSFTFAVKASRYLTHIKRLTGLEVGVKRFYEPLQPLLEAGRLGPILWQLPENFHRRSSPTRRPPTGAFSAFTTATAAGGGTTPRPSCLHGRRRSTRGGAPRPCGRTSTTTGGVRARKRDPAAGTARGRLSRRCLRC
jgi:hypothetical protein